MNPTRKPFDKEKKAEKGKKPDHKGGQRRNSFSPSELPGLGRSWGKMGEGVKSHREEGTIYSFRGKKGFLLKKYQPESFWEGKKKGEG